MRERIKDFMWRLKNGLIWRKIKYKIHDVIENFCDKHHHIAYKTYNFRKWLYVWVMDLEVCHFCLRECVDYYCNECLAETD